MIRCFQYKTKEDWLNGRKNDLTASTLGALWDLHPYVTEYELYHDKKGRLPPKQSNNAMLGGQYFEAGILQYLKDQNPTWTFEHSSKFYTYYREEEARIGATPDVIVEHPERGKGVIQIKTTSYANFKKNWFEDFGLITVPDWIRIQTLIEAYLTESKWAAVAVATLDPFEVHLIEVAFQEGLIDGIKQKVAEFWERFEKDIEPKPSFARDSDTIKKMHSVEDGKILDLTKNNRILELCADRSKQMKLRKSAEDTIKAIDAEVTVLMEDAEIAELPDGKRIQWITTTRKAFSVEPSTSRRLKYPKMETEVSA